MHTYITIQLLTLFIEHNYQHCSHCIVIRIAYLV